MMSEGLPDSKIRTLILQQALAEHPHFSSLVNDQEARKRIETAAATLSSITAGSQVIADQHK